MSLDRSRATTTKPGDAGDGAGPERVLWELPLRRYIARYPDAELELVGARVRLRFVQEIYDAHGKYQGTAVGVLDGARHFGGKVVFPEPRVEHVTGIDDADERDFVRRMMCDLLDVFASVCLCGGLEGECACCPDCNGRGHSPTAKGRQECARCGGTGAVGPRARGPTDPAERAFLRRLTRPPGPDGRK